MSSTSEKPVNMDEEKYKSAVKQDSFLTGFCAGAVGSSLSEFITLPVDTAKVRMMLHGMSGKYRYVHESQFELFETLIIFLYATY